MASIGIIGGGISGLTLALLLKEKGFEVRLFEASDQPGGAIRTTRDPGGWMAEWGPNTIVESSGRIQRLVSMLDLEERRCYPSVQAKNRYIVRDGRMVVAPSSPWELLRTPLLSPKAKLNLLLEPFRARTHGDPVKNEKQESQDHQVIPFTQTDVDEEKNIVAETEETLADFVRRRLGEEFLKWPIDALAGGIYAGNPERLSLRHAFPRIAMLEEQHGSLILGQLKGGVRRPPGSDEIPRNKAAIFSFDNGLQVLPETLLHRLDSAATTGCRVTKISKVSRKSSFPRAGTDADASDSPPLNTGPDAPHRWKLSFDDAGRPSEAFDILIYAGTSYGLREITLPEDMAGPLKTLAGLPHPPVVSLTLGFRRKDIAHPLDGFGVLVPGIERLPILGTLFPSSLFPNRTPDKNHVTLTTYIGGVRQPEIARKEENEQVELTLKTLQKLIGLKGNPLYCQSVKWPEAIPQYETGFGHYLTLMEHLERNNGGFYLAGNYRTGISVGDSINAAFDLAGRVAEEAGRSLVKHNKK